MTKPFSELHKRIDADPQRRARVKAMKMALELICARYEKGLEMEDVADHMEITPQALYELEEAPADWTLDQYRRYALAIGEPWTLPE